MRYDEAVDLVVRAFTGKWEDDGMAGRKKKEVPVVEVPTDNMVRIKRWYEIGPQLAALQAEEHALRQAIVATMFDNTQLEGTEAVEIGGGWKLKTVKRQNISATNAANVMVNLLNYVSALDPALGTELVDWKPDVRTKPYRKLLEMAEQYADLKPLMSAAITIKPGMPELELVAPITVDEGMPA